METRDRMLLALLAGVGAYATYTHWDTLREKLGFDDLRPGRLKAVQLAKDAMTFTPTSPNWITLRDRAKNEEIVVPADPWRASELDGNRFRVTCTWTEAGETHVHVFVVDVGYSSIAYQGEEETRPAPR